ncbi:DUF6879 family protein [Kribbella sp. NPDC059898]|uniref:DUF6879 family protein n=1 Tax=Kribbella sp. NPDC059898 TaxID=3346995 RepID=UPI00364F337A
MEAITNDDLQELLKTFKRSSIHLETRDAYGTEVELPYMAKWAAGEPDDLEWLQDWCTTVRGHVAAGRTIKRARIVSEPLSDYQRWTLTIAKPIVEAGEDERFVPRRQVSELSFPGNDYYVFDDERVVFLHYSGAGLNNALTTTTNPATVEMCQQAFEQVWPLAIPFSEYKPE